MDSTQPSAIHMLSVPVGPRSILLGLPEKPSDCGEGRILYWWSVTASAVALSRHLAGMGDLEGMEVMELGCGPGLPGITAGLLGARVLLTDCVPEALDLAEAHARMNGLDADRISRALVDWEYPGELPQVDLVMGAEILYDYFYHGSLVELLRRVLRPEGVVLLADRKRLAVSRFLGRMLKHGFTCTERVLEIELAGLPRQSISIFKLDRDRDSSP